MRERIIQVFAYLHTPLIQKFSLFLFVFTLFLLAPSNADAQDPNLNGDCATAFDAGVLSAGAACPPPGSTFSTIISMDNTAAIEGAPAITCNPLPANSADVWTTFVASSTALQFEMTGLGQNHIIVYEGTDCTMLNSLACVTLGGTNTYLLTGVTPGNTYFVEAFGGDLSDTGPFTLTVTSINTPDDCSTACDIGPLTPPLSCPPITSSVHNFTLSNIGASEDNANSCGALPTNAADIWVSFTAPGGTTSLIIGANGLAQTNFIVYQGNACGSLTVLDCSQGPNIIVSDVTAGDTYYVEVFGGDPSDVSSAIGLSVTTVGLSEDCFASCDLGQLTPPANCPTPGEAVSSFQLTNIGAFPSPNYPIHPDCIPPNGVSADVWFSFVPASNQVNVNIFGSSGAPWGDAYITLYSGGCSSLTPEECTIGPGTFNVTEGQLYYLQISGPDVATQDDFTLQLGSTRDCNTCVADDGFTASPGPNNGKYQNGDVVQFCYNLNSWVGQGNNWVHAIIPIFGTGWDLATITPILPIATCPTAGGAWGWYSAPWTATVSGNTFPTPGTNTAGAFAFEHTGQGSTPGNDPNNPGDNWGDGCAGNVNATFCFTVQVADCPPLSDGDDLSISIEVYADFQSADWVGSGCVGADDVESDVNYTAVCCNIPDPILSLVQPETCAGACDGAATAISSNPGIRNYIWFDASGNEVFVDNLNGTGMSTATGLCPGTYTVREDDPASFCSGTSNSITVTVGAPQPSVVFVDNSLCFDPVAGPVVNLNFLAGTPPFTINYNEGGIPGTVVLGPGSPFPTNPVSSTLITITSVVDGNGCVNNLPSSILLSPGPSVNITPAVANFCENEDLTLTANGTGGAGGLNYRWTDQNGFLYFGQNITVTNQGTYTVTVTDANFCEIETSISVAQTPAPIALPMAVSNSICANENISLLGSTSTAGIVNQYHWTGPFGFESFDQNPVIPTGSFPVGTGYQFCLDLTLDNGNGLQCPSLPECITVDVKPIPDATIIYNTYCPDEAVVIELFGTTFTTGNSGNVQEFYWTGPSGYESFVQNPVDATEPGIYYLDITIDGCAATQVFEVIDVPEIPTVLIGADGILGLTTVDYCEGEATELNADFSTLAILPSGVTYSWSGPSGYTSNVQNPTNITESGLYSVTVNADYGNGIICPSQNFAFIAVTVAPASPPALDPIGPLCATDAAVALNQTQSTITGTWSGPGVNPAGTIFDPAGLGSATPVNLIFTPNANQCASNATLPISVVPPATIAFTSVDNYCESIMTSQTLAATPTGGTWSGDVDPTGAFNPSTLGMGSYSATYTYTEATANCVTTSTFNFDVNALPNVAIDAVGAYCESDNASQSLSANIAGGTWTGDVDASGSFIPSALGAGTGYSATYTYTDPTTGCTNTDQVNFDITTNPTIQITNPGPLCVDNTAVQTLAATPTGGTWTGDVAPNGEFTPSLLGDGSFSATYTYSDASGICTASDIINFDISVLPTVSIAAATTSYCVDNVGNESFNGSPIGGTWTGDVNAAGAFTPSALGIGTGYTATYTFTDAVTGCINTDQIIFDVIDLPAVSINMPGSFCASDNASQSLSANIAGGTWSGDVDAGGNFVPSNLGAGTGYSATYSYTDPATGCTNTDQVNFDITTNPTIQIVDPGVLCVDNTSLQTLSATPTGGTWSGDVAPNGEFTPSTLGDGSFSATYTFSDASGICTASDIINFDIAVLPTVSIAAATTSFCLDNNANESFDGSPIGGTWTGDVNAAGAFTPSSLGLGSGYTATYTFTDAVTGCVNTDQITFDVIDLPAVSINAPGSFCASDNGSQSLSANVAGGTWSGDVDAGGNFIPSNLGSGNSFTATYTYTDPATGCINTDQTTFAIEAIPTIVIDAVGNLCADDNSPQTLTATPLGGTWTGDVAPNGEFTPSTLGDGSFNATYTYSDASGICTNSDQINFNISPQPTVAIDAVSVYCSDNNNTETLTANPTGGTWTGDVAPNGTFNPSVLGAGVNFTATYTFTDGQGCTNTDQVNFDIQDLPTVSIDSAPAEYCANDGNTQSLVGNPAGGTWSGDVATNGEFVPSTLGLGNNYTATYTYTDPQTNCTNTAEVNFDVQSIPNIDIAAPTTYCGDDTGTQSLSAMPLGGTWSGDVAPNGEFSPAALGSGGPYTATYSFTSAGGCTNTADIQFDIEAVTQIQVGALGIYCASDNSVQQLSATPVGGTWSGDVDPGGSFNPSNLGSGTGFTATYSYTIPGTNCTTTEQVPFEVEAAPTADFIVDSPICSDGTATIDYMGTATNNANYTWNFNGGVAVGSGSGPYEVEWAIAGNYNITLDVEENGCISTQELQIVTVDVPLAEAVINCNTTTNSISFNWNPVANATGYIVNGTLQTGTTIDFSGLTPGTQIDIEVEAVGVGACGNSISLSNCIAENCPPVTIDMPLVAPICLDANATAINIDDPVINGSAAAGTGEWSGDGIIDATTGAFDPNAAALGTNIITYTYTEGPCVFNNTVEIVVNQQPTADFTAPTVICENDTIIINYSGNATLAADYNWDFGTGQIVSGSGAGPYEVFWSNAANIDIDLIVTENSCASDLGTQSIQIEAPLLPPTINCNSSTDFINFTWDPVTDATGYIVNGVLQAGTSFLFDNLTAGDQRTIEVIAVGTGPCGNSIADLTCSADNCPPVVIDLASPSSEICLDAGAAEIQLTANVAGSLGTGTGEWTGSGITDALTGTFDPNAASFGTNTITYTYTEGPCVTIETIEITIYEVPVANFDLTSPLCVGDVSTVTFTGTAEATATYNWDFAGGTIMTGSGAGPYEIQWNTVGNQNVSLNIVQNNCMSTVASDIVVVEEQLAVPTLNCNSSTTSVEFTWAPVTGATGYLVNNVPQTTTTILFDNLTTGDQVCIDIEAIGTGACGNSAMTQLCCNAENCPPVVVTLDAPVIEVCADGTTAPFQITAVVNGSAGTGTETWSGTGVDNNGIFDPAAATIGSNIITYSYTEGPCVTNETIEITVNAQPTADFIAAAQICEGDVTTITYTGTADNTASYNWDFDGGTILSGSGAGPYDISWATGGTKNVALSVTQNNCTSTTVLNSVQVDIPLLEPSINCVPSLTSIDFSWAPIVGATGYIVNGMPQAGTTFTAGGLTTGESFTLQVIAVGTGACGNSVSEETCVASNCPGFVVDLPAVSAICLDGNTGIITLMANVAGGVGNGTVTWSGPGIIDATTGLFDPAVAQTGDHVITFDYAEGVCTASETTIIIVNPQPSADFVVVSPICEGDPTTITYTGTALLSSDYNWNFDGGLVQSGSGAGPYEIVWPVGGNKNITLDVTQDNCGSAPFAEIVAVEMPMTPPNINCSSTTESITFTWDPVPGATGYLVNGNPQAGTTFMETGLNAGDMITIEVTAIGTGPCGNSINTETCTAENCPDVNITIDQVAPYCVDPANPVANLVVAVVGSTTGTGTWSGPGIIDPVNGVFDPNAASTQIGANTITYEYVDGICTTTETIDIMVNDLPTVDAGMTAELSCDDPQLSLAATGTGLPTWTGPGIVSGANSFDPVINMPGDYTILVTDPTTGCTNTDVVNITQNASIPLADAGTDAIIDCINTSANLMAGGSIGAGFEITWTGPGIVDPTDPNQTVTQEGQYILTILNTMSQCVSTPDTVDVTFDLAEPIAGIILPSSTIDCNTSSIALNAENAANVGVTYEWTGPAGAAGTDPTVNATAAGIYTVVITNPNGCTATDNVEIMDDFTPPAAVTGTSPTLDCTVSQVSLSGAGSSTGSNITYLWTGPSIVGDDNTIDIDADVAGIYTLLVTNTDNGCTSTETLIVLADANAPVADAGLNQELDCQENDIVLSGGNSSGGNLFIWTDANGVDLSQSQTVTVNQLGTYYLQVTNTDNGCVDIDSVSIVPTQNIPNALTTTVVDPSCFGENNAVIAIDTVIGGTPPYVYSLDGNAFFDFNQFFNLTAGNYNLQVEDANGCNYETDVTINDPTQLVLDLGEDIVLSLGDTSQSILAQINVPRGFIDTLMWSSQDLFAQQLVNCADEDCYEVLLNNLNNEASFSATLIDTLGCSTTDDVNVRFEKERLIYIPSAFSPISENSENQVFMINGGQGVERILSFNVYNRWGEVVFSGPAAGFQPNDPQYAWKGDFRGKMMNPGVFVYQVEVLFVDGEVILYSGDVTLLR